jgi:catalase
MRLRWSFAALVFGLGTSPSILAAQANLPQQIADVIVKLNGGIHTGFRFMHAKGLVVTGTFTAAPSAKSISRAAHLKGGSVPVTVRFSDGTGNPMIPDTDGRGSPRGMAIRFTLPGGGFTDIVAISHNGFVVGTGEDFLAFLTAVANTKPDSPHPTPIEEFLGAHPRAFKFLNDSKPLPVSFATLAYFSNNAVIFVDSAGTKRAGRFQILPAAGIVTMDPAAMKDATPNYLFEDLPKRLAKGPVSFRLVAQMANPGDQTNDGSVVWPDNHKTVELGTISLTTVAPNNDELQRSLTYNPIFLTSGIELSDDPLPVLRSSVYALSIAHRK